MSVSINLSEGNQVTIQRVDPTAVTLLNLVPNEVTIQQQSPIAVSLANAVANQVNVQQQNNIAVSLTNQTPIAVTVNSQVSSGGGAWGEITGTVTDQTDLVSYITSVLPDVPYETAQDILNALNTLSGGSLAFSVRPVFNSGIELGDPDVAEIGTYTLPKVGVESIVGVGNDKYGYFLFTDSDGNLGWKSFPLEFLTGFDEGAQVDGGTF